MASVMSGIGNSLARFLTKPTPHYQTFSVLSKEQLLASLRPGDLLLVEGNSRVSSAIKYLTQSTWSHVCIYIGEREGLQPVLEADLIEGVITVPIDKYDGFNLRICRPVNLTAQDEEALLSYLIDRIGHQYDTKNIFDLMRYLLPTPPVPERFRRSLLAFGSGDPTKAICSTLVAQAFQSIRYPILPLEADPSDLEAKIKGELNGEENRELNRELNGELNGEFAKGLKRNTGQQKTRKLKDEITLKKRHFSHFTPRDFDLSPYFEIVKPTITGGFDYQAIRWHED